MPVVFVILLTTFRSIDWRLLQAAATLGANRWQQIRLVLLPLIKGGAVAAFLFGLLHSFEDLTIALFVGANQAVRGSLAGRVGRPWALAG